MKKILKLMLLPALAFALCACEKTDETDNGGNGGNNNGGGTVAGEDYSDVPAITTYKFDGEELPIRAVYAAYDGYYYYFMFTEEPYNTTARSYISFALVSAFTDHEQLVGPVVGGLSHNDDYIFSFETPVWAFSRWRQLQSGTVLVEPLGGNFYHVELDVALPNGMPFYLDYTGEFKDLFEFEE